MADDIGRQVDTELVRDILVALAKRDGLSLDSAAAPGTPARNYELALRLRIGHVFGLHDDVDEHPECDELGAME